MTLKIGIDLDCLLSKPSFSKAVVDHDYRDIRIYFTTENLSNLKERITNLLIRYPEFGTFEKIFDKKEHCDYHIDKIDLPEEWFSHKAKINKAYQKLVVRKKKELSL